VEDSIDAGVHPAVAALRRQEMKQRSVQDAMTTRPWLGQSRTAPRIDLNKVAGGDPAYNPMNFFKQAKSLDVNPMQGLIPTTEPSIPKPGASKKDQKGKREDKKKKKKDKKDKARCKKKKKKAKKNRKKKSKSSTLSSTSSLSSPSSSNSDLPCGKKRKADRDDKASSKSHAQEVALAQQRTLQRAASERALMAKQATSQWTSIRGGASSQSANSAMCPMRPEIGHEMDRQAEAAYSKLCVVRGGVQRGAPTSAGPVGG